MATGSVLGGTCVSKISFYSFYISDGRDVTFGLYLIAAGYGIFKCTAVRGD